MTVYILLHAARNRSVVIVENHVLIFLMRFNVFRVLFFLEFCLVHCSGKLFIQLSEIFQLSFLIINSVCSFSEEGYVIDDLKTLKRRPWDHMTEYMDRLKTVINEASTLQGL